MDSKNEISAYLENISLFLLGILFLSFPLIFTNLTTDAFIFPKQILLAIIVLLTITFLAVRMISVGAVRIRHTPFDLPLSLFALFAILSSFFAINKADSIISVAPFIFAVLSYFIIVNFVKNKVSLFYLILSFVIGGSILSIFVILSTFNIYAFPFEFTKAQTFSPFGPIIDQTIYLFVVLSIAIFVCIPFIKNSIKNKTFKKDAKEIPFIAGSIIITLGLIVSIYQFAVIQKPPILPLETGFQTAFAAISQDSGRTVQGFLFGSGFGTYTVDFTRFKQPVFNLNDNLWSLTFFKSSNFILELLATTGLLGLSSFVFLLLKIVKELKLVISRYNHQIDSKNFLSIPLLLIVISSFIFPFSFASYAVFFFILGLFAVVQGINYTSQKNNNYYDMELHFVAFKKSFFPISTTQVPLNEEKSERTFTKILPVSFFIIILAVNLFVGLFVVRYITADILFQSSIVAASTNNGLETYNKQVNAIQLFPNRDAYHRIYSQTNLALANSLASNIAKNSSPSAQTQQTIYTLIQQSINSARVATSISPQTAINWQNLSSIYRSLIGFGQNAESFSLLSQQQAIILDPNNPQVYLNLGGIYFQLKQFETAQRQFQIAVNLKPDFANAHYNLGHALESKGDLQGALEQYQIVKNLIVNDSVNSKKIALEIQAIQKNMEETQKIAREAKAQPKVLGEAEEKTATKSKKKAENAEEELKISSPSAQLPEAEPKVKIPPPDTATESGKSSEE